MTPQFIQQIVIPTIEILATSVSTFFQRSHVSGRLRWLSKALLVMFWSRNATGSIFAAYASSSTSCSYPNRDPGASGARNAS